MLLVVHLDDEGKGGAACVEAWPLRSELLHAAASQCGPNVAYLELELLVEKFKHILNQWARFLYKPLLEDRVMPIQETGGVAYGAGVAAKVHRELRKTGGVTPPREFVLMDRAAIGLGSVFTHLKAEINWHRLFHDLIDGFDEQMLKKRQKKALKAFDIPLPD